LIRKALLLLAVFSFACSLRTAFAQTETPPTAFDRQLHKLDLSITGVGEYNTTVTGPVIATASNQGESITQFGSNTAGLLISLQYVAKPYVGLEINYGSARYTENYQGPGISDPNALGLSLFQVQTKANEYSFGYVATPPHKVFSLQPFLGAGFGTLAFKPTAFGGQELPEKARALYYYSVGLQKDYGAHFGLKVGFRELFFIDPDFGQNYLTIVKHANTYEPMAGFYLRY
jgi:hypothetical protein